MTLIIGDTAPSFKTTNQDGKEVSLSDFTGKNKVILYFYPRDNTPGCTAEACSLRDGFHELTSRGFVVLGVSGDSMASHQKFKNAKELPFDLLMDEDHAIATLYGTWGLKKFMGREFMGIIRKTFIISEDGKIERIFDKVQTKDHFNQILKSYE